MKLPCITCSIGVAASPHGELVKIGLLPRLAETVFTDVPMIALIFFSVGMWQYSGHRRTHSLWDPSRREGVKDTRYLKRFLIHHCGTGKLYSASAAQVSLKIWPLAK